MIGGHTDMASFTVRTATGAVETMAVCEYITAFHACIGSDQQSFPLGRQCPSDMIKMFIHLLFTNGQQLGNFQGIDLFTA